MSQASEPEVTSIPLKMAKASKEDIEKTNRFFQFIDEFMEYGTHTPINEEYEEESIDLTDEAFVAKLRELWGRRFGPAGVDCSWSRVVWGCDMLIDNVCNPEADTLEWKPEIADKLDEENGPTARMYKAIKAELDGLKEAATHPFSVKGRFRFAIEVVERLLAKAFNIHKGTDK